VIDIYIEKCRESAVIPVYACEDDAGMDVAAAEDTIIKPGETVIVVTGLKFAIPKGYEIQVRPRSGITLNTPLRVSNSPGTIDCGYRGELGIIMSNISDEIYKNKSDIYTIGEKGNCKGTYVIKKRDRIAQIILNKVWKMNFKTVSSVGNIGQDRGGGFGSTGVR
jgi:dUTP pyrophosphatase